MTDMKTFVLTGCASGIGQHLADVLIAQGHRVFATDINLAALEEHARVQNWPTERVPVRSLDVRDAAAWKEILQEAVAAFGSVDVLMNYVTIICPDAVQTPMFDRQKRYDEAVLTFSAPKLLKVEDIARVILKQVLPRKPLEVFVPVPRGLLARFVDLFPGTSSVLLPFFRRRARIRQARLRGQER